MEHVPAVCESWTLLLDPAATQSLIERVSKLNLPRRVCRPLDRKHGQGINADLARFDDAIEAEAANDEIMGEDA